MNHDEGKLSRRSLLTSSLGGLAGLAGVSALVGGGRRAFGQAADICTVTEPQIEGPYYPETKITNDADLTVLRPGAPRAKGQVIYILGRVQGEDCGPLAGARLEVWQACASGKYNHSQDTNPLPLDPNFQYWGKADTGADGSFAFKTIVPGHYPTGGGNYRPPHVHFKIYAEGFYALTTQMYFNPKSYDDAALAALVDKLNKLEDDPESLMVWFQPAGAGFEAGAKRGEFDITLRAH